MSYRETSMRAETRLRLLPQPRLHSWKWRWWETLRCRCILEVEVTRDTVWWTGGWGRRETNQEWSLVFWPPQPRERPLMPVKENSGPGRRKPDFRFGHVDWVWDANRCVRSTKGLAGARLSHQHREDCVSAEGEMCRTDHVHVPCKRLFRVSVMIHAYLCQGSDRTYGKPECRPRRGRPLGSHWKGSLSSITRFNNLGEETTHPYFHINLPNFYIPLIL